MIRKRENIVARVIHDSYFLIIMAQLSRQKFDVFIMN